MSGNRSPESGQRSEGGVRQGIRRIDAETRRFVLENTSGAGYVRMDASVSCVITRVRSRSVWGTLSCYVAFRRTRLEAQKINGLLRTAFFIEGLHTCYTFSLWADEAAIIAFGSLPSHVKAARVAFGTALRREGGRPEIWSAQFKLWAVSSRNMNWEGLDLETVLGGQWTRREEVELALSEGRP